MHQLLNKLLQGNYRFISDTLERKNQDASRRKSLTKGQNPFAIVLSCADSRVVPELIFDTGIGDLFVIRVAGNIANCSSLASIEYAVAQLGCKLIVVLGHENCGAVAAAMQQKKQGKNLDHLLAHIQPAIDQCPNSGVNEVVQKNATITADTLIHNSKIIRKAVESNELSIKSAFYHMQTGKVELI